MVDCLIPVALVRDTQPLARERLTFSNPMVWDVEP
jgi:hypothetical protein